ncbi:MFS transporter [Roseococcus sp. YIM B11640]|uniref:MFS transporter n=1 Tax=Roseococcus sp. YIM B11640 TaxID=3133973 RepID=UPI003C7AEB75
MRIPDWVGALYATLLMQTVAAVLGHGLTVLAPLITADAGMPPESVGHLSALSAGGTALFLLLGGPFLTRWGPVRTLQIGATVSASAMLLAGLGTAPVLLGAALLLGIGYGPTPPAGSRILAATAPPQHRALIFSIKQAGAPMGGAIAGLGLAPIAAHFGWPTALLAAVALSLLAAASIQPFKTALDRERDPAQRLDLGVILHRATWLAPLRALALHPALPPLTWLAVSFAVVQGCLFAFTVTWLTVDRGFSIVDAGMAFASLQAAGVVARILLGWVADRMGRPMRHLVVQALAGAAVTAGFGLMPAGLPLLAVDALAFLTGFLAASWNGIYLSEVARLAPPAMISAATAGSTLFTFIGYLAAPAAFALVVALGGSWALAFGLCGAQLAAIAIWVGPRLWRG